MASPALLLFSIGPSAGPTEAVTASLFELGLAVRRTRACRARLIRGGVCDNYASRAVFGR